MVWVIFASALGVISVTGGLFLRRLLGEITELRRQITGIDREMRAQRARMKFLRYLHDNTENSTDGTPPDEAAVANGGMEHPPHAAGEETFEPEPVRRKKHLGLYLGGAVAALATIGNAARTAVREHQGQLIGAVAGAAVSAATVTMVAVQPWTTDTSNEPPSSAPTAAPPPTSSPPSTVGPPPPTTPGVEPPSPSPSTTETDPSPNVSASLSPSALAPTNPEATGSTVPIVDETPPAAAPDPTTPSDGGTPGSEGPPDEPGRGTPPTASPTSPPAAEPSPGLSLPSAIPADEALSVRVDVKRALGAKARLLAT